MINNLDPLATTALFQQWHHHLPLLISNLAQIFSCPLDYFDWKAIIIVSARGYGRKWVQGIYRIVQQRVLVIAQC